MKINDNHKPESEECDCPLCTLQPLPPVPPIKDTDSELARAAWHIGTAMELLQLHRIANKAKLFESKNPMDIIGNSLEEYAMRKTMDKLAELGHAISILAVINKEEQDHEDSKPQG